MFLIDVVNAPLFIKWTKCTFPVSTCLTLAGFIVGCSLPDSTPVPEADAV